MSSSPLAERAAAAISDDIQYVDMRYTNGFAIGWRGALARGSDEDGSKNG